MEEFSVSSQFKQATFKQLRDAGLQLENVVYYQGETHYFVMTPTVGSLHGMGVIRALSKDPAKCVASDNINRAKLHEYARQVATFFGLPSGTPFVASNSSAQLFDFSARSTTKVPSKLYEKGASQLLVCVNGDALIEPFWPEGLGVNRGFLSVLDTAYLVQEYFSTGKATKEEAKKMMKCHERLFNMMKPLSGHTKKETLREDFRSYNMDPNTRYMKWKSGY